MTREEAAIANFAKSMDEDIARSMQELRDETRGAKIPGEEIERLMLSHSKKLAQLKKVQITKLRNKLLEWEDREEDYEPQYRVLH